MFTIITGLTIGIGMDGDRNDQDGCFCIAAAAPSRNNGGGQDIVMNNDNTNAGGGGDNANRPMQGVNRGGRSVEFNVNIYPRNANHGMQHDYYDGVMMSSLTLSVNLKKPKNDNAAMIEVSNV